MTTSPPESIDWSLVTIGILGGIAMLLVGVTQISSSLQALSGSRMQSALSKVSSNRIAGATTGAVTTAVVQSSSATTVLTVSFVSAGLLTVTQAAGVVIGANLGTTVTAQIVALDIALYALAIVALGGLLMIAPSESRRRLAGEAIFGLGLVFLGLAAMSEAMLPLRQYEPLTTLLASSDNRLLAALAGAVAAAILQSSSATTGIVVAMSAAGLVSLPTGIAIVIGANIGTCVTAVLAALGRGAEAMQTAMVHVLVNVIGAAIWLIGLDFLVHAVERVSESTGDLAMATPRELANAHTLFNVANTVLFLAILPLLVRTAQRMVPAEPGTPSSTRPHDPLPALMPSLDQRSQDLMAKVLEQLRAALPAALTADAHDIDVLIDADAQVDAIHRGIVDECSHLGQRDLGSDQRADLEAILVKTNALELIADQVKLGVLRAGSRRAESGRHFGSRTSEFLLTLNERVIEEFLRIMDPNDASPRPEDSGEQRSPPDFDAAYHHLTSRLLAGIHPTTYALSVELVAALEQINSQIQRYGALKASAAAAAADD